MPIRKGDTHMLKEVSWPEVREHVSDLANSLDALLATVQGRFERNNRSLGLFNLGLRAVHELRRVAERLEGDIEDLAWSVRNLHEIDLTLRYVLLSDQHFEEWTAQMITDEKDIVEGFMTLAAEVPPAVRAPWEERLQRIQRASPSPDSHGPTST